MSAISCTECQCDEFEARYYSTYSDGQKFNGLRCRGCGQIFMWSGTYLMAERGKRVMTSLDKCTGGAIWITPITANYVAG